MFLKFDQPILATTDISRKGNCIEFFYSRLDILGAEIIFFLCKIDAARTYQKIKFRGRFVFLEVPIGCIQIQPLYEDA